MSDATDNPKNLGGRPTVWTKAIEDKVFQSLEVGMSRRRSAHRAGIAESTLFKRIAEDPWFSEQCLMREADGVFVHCERLRNPEILIPEVAAATINAAKFYLSTHDEAFRDTQRIEHSGNVAVSLTDVVANIGKSKPSAAYDSAEGAG